MSTKAKPRLSKGILEMKFMMKSKVKVNKEEEDNEGKSMYQNEITGKMKKSNFHQEQGFANIEELSVCRYSCRGMNPEIEKLLQEHNYKETNHSKMETEISDKDLENFYSKSNSSNTGTQKRKTREYFQKITKKTKER